MIELEYHIPVPRDAVWNYLTQNTHIEKWWDKTTRLQPLKTGAFTELVTVDEGRICEVSGLITAFEAPHRLQMNYSRCDWDISTRLEFLLTPEDNGTRLYLQHGGWESFSDEKERRTLFDSYVTHWNRVIDRFSRYCAETL